jgi:D-glycero-D-manno-heptose 1,7-bisphosphate phosphatase
VVADRDGTLIEERHYLSDPSQVRLIEGVADGLAALQQHGVGLAIVTNQSGIGRGYFTEHDARLVNDRVVQLLESEGVRVSGVYLCPHRPDQGCRCRKPATGLVERAARDHGFSRESCVVVGDKRCDIALGRAFGAPTVLVRTGYGRQYPADAESPDLVLEHAGQLEQAFPLLTHGSSGPTGRLAS